jgi:hypothetical protein
LHTIGGKCGTSTALLGAAARQFLPPWILCPSLTSPESSACRRVPFGACATAGHSSERVLGCCGPALMSRTARRLRRCRSTIGQRAKCSRYYQTVLVSRGVLAVTVAPRYKAGVPRIVIELASKRLIAQEPAHGSRRLRLYVHAVWAECELRVQQLDYRSSNRLIHLG